ncbi:MAG: phosphoribosylamine--glycine ligase [Planctomycetota bacterium]
MKVLVIGSGAREHALIWKLEQSDKVSKIYAAPGSDAISEHAECIDIAADKTDALIKFAKQKEIDLTIVGPEDPLVNGITDKFEKKGLKIFGPSEKAARLEGSKKYAKEVMSRHGIQTGGHKVYHRPEPAMAFLENCDYPVVIKADGLAAGKGVTVVQNLEEGEAAIKEAMVDNRFGEAGAKLLIEDFLIGQEVSLHAITDGRNIVALELAQDHKPVGDGDIGENTGGMGTYSPLPQISDSDWDEIEREILVQTIHAMNHDGVPFKGVIFIGVMMTRLGPKVLEYNVRFGDPETQVMMARMKSDLFELLNGAVNGELENVQVDWDSRFACNVVLASGGYPRSHETGYKIKGLDSDFGDDVIIFHAGTKKVEGEWFTNGGRVLSVVGMGDSLESARKTAYAAVEKISFDRMQYRTDIGFRGLK